jgi:hypothetical protein
MSKAHRSDQTNQLQHLAINNSHGKGKAAKGKSPPPATSLLQMFWIHSNDHHHVGLSTPPAFGSPPGRMTRGAAARLVAEEEEKETLSRTVRHGNGVAGGQKASMVHSMVVETKSAVPVVVSEKAFALGRHLLMHPMGVMLPPEASDLLSPRVVKSPNLNISPKPHVVVDPYNSSQQAYQRIMPAVSNHAKVAFPLTSNP